MQKLSAWRKIVASTIWDSLTAALSDDSAKIPADGASRLRAKKTNPRFCKPRIPSVSSIQKGCVRWHLQPSLSSRIKSFNRVHQRPAISQRIQLPDWFLKHASIYYKEALASAVPSFRPPLKPQSYRRITALFGFSGRNTRL